MTQKNPKLIQDGEVYALTPRGEQELRGSETSLSPEEIELLVLVDGVSTVEQIAAEALPLSRDTVVETLGKLRDSQFISLDTGGPASDELGILFDAVPTQPTRKTLSAATSEASAGVSSLKKQGFYARIARRRPDSARPAEGKTLSAVVIEDEPLLAKFLVQYLSFEGFSTRTAGNRAQVIAELSRAPAPDLVLLDVMLPDADGFDILLRMRQHPVLKTVPVIMLTAKATREAVLKGLAGGADGYVTKPFEADALIKAVRAVVGLSNDAAEKKKDLKR